MTASATCGCYSCRHKLYHDEKPDPDCPMCDTEGDVKRSGGSE